MTCAELLRGDAKAAINGGGMYYSGEYLSKIAAAVEGLEAENTKLRELVRIMHSELVSCEDNGYICGGHKFDKRVNELGIDVDG